MVLGRSETPCRSRALLGRRSDDSGRRENSSWLGGNDRLDSDAALRLVSSPELRVANRWSPGAAADEQAAFVHQPERVLGQAMEHRVPGHHPSFPVSTFVE